MLEKPIMSKVFDVVEEGRAKPNGRTPFNEEVIVIKDVVYKEIDGQKLYMDVYLPPAKDGDKTPVVLDIPGGGWMIHNRNRRDGYAKLLAVMGAAVCVIDHRLSPQIFFPENLKDVIDAINYLGIIGAKYNFDLDKLTLIGDSSGAHLAACVGCAATSKEYSEKLALPTLDIKPCRMIFISGAFSFETMYRIPFTHLLIVRYFSGQKTRKDYRSWKFYRESDPYNYITQEFPPCYNAGGQTDFLCLGEAKRMATKLSDAKVLNDFYVGKNLFNSGHCYIMRLPFAPARRDTLKMLDWYRVQMTECGCDMSKGYNRVKTFLTNYRAALKGRIEC